MKTLFDILEYIFWNIKKKTTFTLIKELDE